MSRLLVLQHLEREHAGLFAKLAKERGFTVCIFRLDLGDTLPELTNKDLLLVLGGPMSVKDIGAANYPWLITEVDLIKKALNQGIGIIGVCLGAQLLAYAAGGDVELLKDRLSNKPLAEIGWHNIFSQSLDKKHKLSKLLAHPLTVLHWHGDRILLPKTAELFASSGRCREQLFSIGSSAYGLQFHAETDYEMVNTWIAEDEKFISSALGKDGSSILKKQQKEFGHTTLSYRLELLDALFDLII